MKTLYKKSLFITLALVLFVPGFAFAQFNPNVNAQIVPIANENAFLLRVNSLTGIPPINLEYRAEYRLSNSNNAWVQTPKYTYVYQNTFVPFEQKVPYTNIVACSNYQFYIFVKPVTGNYTESKFGPYYAKTIGCPDTVSVPGLEETQVPGPETPPPSSATLKNPLGGSITSLFQFVEKLVDVVLVIAIPIIALAIIYSGFMIVTARGNEQKLTAGKKAFAAAVIGGVLVLGSYVLAKAIGATVQEIRE